MHPLHTPRRASLACALLAVPLPSLTRPGDEPPSFHPPVRLETQGVPIATEAPGYACPAWHDVDGDGRADLVVGQFAGGKMAVHLRAEDGSFSPRTWLEAAGAVAQVPGVW